MAHPRLVYVVTVATTARLLLKGQLSFIQRAGFDVTLIASPSAELDELGRREGVNVLGVHMRRSVSPYADTRALWQLFSIFRKLRPHVVNASTPKAGLLGMLAARAADVPVRIYLLRGLRLETLGAIGRTVMGITERSASAAATHVYSVSQSLRRAYLEGQYCEERKVRVLGSGSSNGVDLARFERTPEREVRAAQLRGQLGIRPETVVIGFMGRPVPDKGLRELTQAFERLGTRDVVLLVVGGDLAGDSLDRDFCAWAHGNPRVLTIPQVSNPEEYHAAFDLLAFPSHREGFPNVPLEAAASGRPTVGFEVTGVMDAVISGSTGLLVPAADVEAFSQALIRYVDDPALRQRHGTNARIRASDSFATERVWNLWRDEYGRICREHGLETQAGLPAKL